MVAVGAGWDVWTLSLFLPIFLFFSLCLVGGSIKTEIVSKEPVNTGQTINHAAHSVNYAYPLDT